MHASHTDIKFMLDNVHPDFAKYNKDGSISHILKLFPGPKNITGKVSNIVK